MDGVPGVPCYVGPPVNGLSQFNVFLPKGVRTGLVPVRVEWHGETALSGCDDSRDPARTRGAAACFVQRRRESGFPANESKAAP